MKLEPKGVMAVVWVVLLAKGGLCGSLWTDHLTVRHGTVAQGEFRVMQTAATNNGELYYGFDEPASGSQVDDDSFNGNGGTLIGTNVVWSSEVPSGTNGGSSLLNNGGTEDSYIDVSYGADLALTGPFTLAAWIKRTVSDNTQAIIMKGATYNSIEYGLAENEGSLLMVSRDGDGGGAVWSTNAPISIGTWYHVAAVLEGSGENQAKLYVNGELVGQGTLPLPNAGTSLPLYVGRWRNEYYYRGYIDDARIFTRALSASEIAVLASNGWSQGESASALTVEDDEVTIPRLKKQGDIGMGSYINGP